MIELKIKKVELNYYKDIKNTIDSLKDNTIGKYKFNVTSDFIGADTKNSIDFTLLLDKLQEFDLKYLESAIDTLLKEHKNTIKKIKRYYKMYMKRGFFYTKYKKIRQFLLENNYILRYKLYDNTRYEVLTWNECYKRQFNQF